MPNESNPSNAVATDLELDERAVKQEEFAARREEARLRLSAASAPWWRRADPLVLAVSAGVFTLAGNIFIAWYNANTTIAQEQTKAANDLQLEREKAKASLVTQAVSTDDAVTARRNLLFFVDAGLISDPDQKIRMAAEKYAPVLPSATGASRSPPTSPDGYANAFWSATLRADWINQIDATIDKIVSARPQLEKVGQATQTPWYLVGVFWMLETGGSFSVHLLNGDPLTAQTVHVPAHRPEIWPPPPGQDPWEYSAADAIRYYKLSRLEAAGLGEMLSALELANGRGYQSRGLFSPYLWNGTNLYDKGKFVSDHIWDPNAVSAQVGAVALLRRLQDKSVIDLRNAVAAAGPTR